MSLFTRFIVATMPLVPKALVGKVAKRYVAGENRADAMRVVRELNSRALASASMASFDRRHFLDAGGTRQGNVRPAPLGLVGRVP